jgi:hypothetical protein
LTLGTYSHVTPRMHEEAASAMQDILFDSPSQDAAHPAKKKRK